MMPAQSVANLKFTLLENQSLAEHTYYKMGGTAQYFAMPNDIFQLQNILFWAQSNDLHCAVLGSGSNSVFADGIFSGVVISMEKLKRWHWESKEYLFVEAGVTNTEVSEICAAADRLGASWMYRMPGQIGATVRMNARCYGGEISQLVHQVITINPHGILNTYSAADLFLGYKDTLLMSKPEIVVSVRLHLPMIADAKNIMTHMHECEADRHGKHHFDLPSCGSTFKNNYTTGKPSGRIFDELGLKGTKRGDAEVSQFHANFIWNTGHATTNDMLDLAAFMRDEALKRAHVELDLEVQPIGLFSDELFLKCGMNHLGPSTKDTDQKRWVGLLNQTEQKDSFPLKIFDCPFSEYHQDVVCEVPQVKAQLIQLKSFCDAQTDPGQPFLRWIISTRDLPEKIFSLAVASHSSSFTDQLWNYSVAEIFFANAKNPNHYFEFEMTPEGQWIALEFEDVRKRTARNQIPNESLWPGVFLESLKIQPDGRNQISYTFGMSFSFDQIKDLLHEKEILIQSALSLGNQRYFLSPYWKCEDKKKKADFHQPNRYWKIQFF
jgi:UDP-N-acetylmuramate dehydrogenase